MTRTEFITRGNCSPAGELAPGVELRVFVSAHGGAQGLSTGTATLRPGSDIPYHTHPFSEAITVLSGVAVVVVEGRRYRLRHLDCMHVPAGTPHRVANGTAETPAVLQWAFATATPSRDLVSDVFTEEDRSETDAGCPEHLTRFDLAAVYELSPGALFRDLFSGRIGARGICGGYGLFAPGSSLPCHVHEYDESITIIDGRATCQVAGREYELSGCDTACVPRSCPHRFINRSDQPMAMIWVYAGDEPQRTLVDQGFCAGLLPVEQLARSTG